MQVTLNVEPGTMGESLAEVLASLTEVQKQEIATQALNKWLKEPYDTERLAQGQEVVRQLRQDTYHSRDFANKSDAEVMKHYAFADKMKNFVTTKERMVKTITEETIRHQKEAIVTAIKTDPTMNAVMDETLKYIKENFAAFTHDAMMAWFCQNMATMTSGMQTALIQTQNNQNYLNDIQKRLDNRGIY